MGIEAADYLTQLVATNPVGATDGLNTADDHIRLIKHCLLLTFPHAASTINPTPVEFNYLVGVTSLIQTQLNAKLASSGYTAADVLAKLLTVDGIGSGLDADLLDGHSSAFFVTGSNMTGSVPLADAFSTAGGSAPCYACRAFGRFTNNSAGTIVGGANYSISRVSSGLYTITFGTAMAAATYSVVFGAQQIAGNPSIQAQISESSSPGAGGFSVEVTNGSARVELGGSVHFAVFG